MKLTKRKGFNFFRSYYDVYNELEKPEDKLAFIEALLDRQFLGVQPTGLTGMAKFAYVSQINSIDSQVKGFQDKTGIELSTPTEPPCQGGKQPPTEPPCQGGKQPPTEPPCQQVEVEGEEKGEVKEEEKKLFLLKKETKKSKSKSVKLIDYSVPVDERRTKFRETLKQHESEYGIQMIENFFLYWSEKTTNEKQMRFEMVIETKKTWELKLRLARWKNNNFVGAQHQKDNPLGTHRIGTDFSKPL